jgi:hypothetical protein
MGRQSVVLEKRERLTILNIAVFNLLQHLRPNFGMAFLVFFYKLRL